MAFDPSTIGAIADSQYNAPESIGRATTLREMADTEQLKKLQLNSAKSDAEDATKVKAILSQNDYTTPQGLAKTAQDLNRVSPKASMDLMKWGQQYQSGEIQQKMDALTLDQQKTDFMVKTLDPILSEARQLKASGASDLDVKALIASKVPTALQRLRAPGPDGKPILADEALKQITAQPQTLATLEGFEGQASDHAKKLQMALEQFKAQTQAKGEQTRERAEAERERHDMAREDIEAKRSEQGRKAPAGFEWDPDKTDELRPIKGGPKDPNSKPWSGREKVFAQRIVTSADEAVRAITNITELPIKASSGVFGTGHSDGGLFSSGKAALTNAMAPQDVQDYNSMLAGVKRNLATIESTGLAPSGALTENFGSLELRSGDTNLTKLRKLAEMRQVVQAGLEPQLADEAIPNTIKDLMRKINGDLEKAVPYTQSDVTKLQRAQQKNPSMTFEDLIGKEKLNKSKLNERDTLVEAKGHELTPGTKFQHSSGATVEILSE
jgi:hypothetical protein